MDINTLTDIDGDGRADVIAIQPNPLRFVTWKNNGAGFDGGVEGHTEGYDYGGYRFFVGDLDSDGRADVIAVQPSPLRFVTWKNNGAGFDGGVEGHTETYDYGGYRFFVGDIDGDDRADVIAIAPSPLRMVTWKNNGAGFDGGVEWHSEAYDYTSYRFFMGDIDGDKRVDIIAVATNPLRIVTWRNNGAGFDGGVEWHSEAYNYSGYRFFVGDIDGDKRVDIIAVSPNPLRIVTWKNNGAGFDGGVEWHSEVYNYSGYRFFVGDIDGDKRADIIAVSPNPLRIVTWKNNGAGFDGGVEWHSEVYNYSGYLFPPSSTRLYSFALDSFQINNTRASHTDTDYVAASVIVGEGVPQTQVRAMGDLNNGTYPVGFAFENVPVSDNENAVFSYSIVNSGHANSDQAKQTLEQAMSTLSTQAADAATAAIAPQIGVALGELLGTIAVPLIGSALGALAGWLVTSAGSLIFANCDGTVAAGVHVFDATSLNGNIASASDHNVGADSPGGCGSNSDYYVKWSVRGI